MRYDTLNCLESLKWMFYNQSPVETVLGWNERHPEPDTGC